MAIAEPPAPAPAPPPPLPVCVVLSVGSEQGLAHIGVLRALKERNVPIDCVVGTSMGAVVGGLYAAAPDIDVATSYGIIAAEYGRRAKGDLVGLPALGALFGVAFAGVTGGLSLAAGAGAGAAVGALNISLKDWARLSKILQEQYRGVTIESLPVRYGTVFQILTEEQPLRLVKGGSLSDAIASSIRNPLIFEDVKVSTGAKIDPGFDRVAAVPVQDACDMFPGRQLVVSSVSGAKVFVAPNLSCPYQLVVIERIEADRTAALSAEDPHFGRLIDAGYQAAVHRIDWGRLPSSERPPAPLPQGPTISEVDVTLVVEVNPTKPDGRLWDGVAPLPDIKHRTTLRACPEDREPEQCDGYGTSASTPPIRGKQQEDTLTATWSLGRLRLREGMVFEVELIDGDVSDDDPIGKFTVPFSRPGGGVAVPGEAGTVTVLFGEESED